MQMSSRLHHGPCGRPNALHGVHTKCCRLAGPFLSVNGRQQRPVARQAETKGPQVVRKLPVSGGAQLLLQLLQAKDPAAYARANVDLYQEEFFQSSWAFIAMAEREGSKEVVQELHKAMRIAMDAKQASLRPELQLMNLLMAAPDGPARAKIWAQFTEGDKAPLDGAFFTRVLARFSKDVASGASGTQKDKNLQDRLRRILSESSIYFPT
ncbi:hypothetical protein ACKKBG_A10115 [Auxenochlorella protothecoides x Auxenochlorella symbiontica]|uniref:Uncharacterized protein n=1 Tax=Auxenochlorella protothecoides TaxID=3075 RepID=A0A1D2AA84_AUXPR